MQPPEKKKTTQPSTNKQKQKYKQTKSQMIQ